MKMKPEHYELTGDEPVVVSSNEIEHEAKHYARVWYCTTVFFGLFAIIGILDQLMGLDRGIYLGTAMFSLIPMAVALR